MTVIKSWSMKELGNVTRMEENGSE